MSATEQYSALAASIREWAAELGFQQVGITGIDLGEHQAYLQRWLDAGYHGEMEYMARLGGKRVHPEELVPGTLRVLSLRMDYMSDGADPVQVLEAPEKAYISRYTLGRGLDALCQLRQPLAHQLVIVAAERLA